MNLKQTTMKLSLGLMSLILLIITGCGRVDPGMMDDKRAELDYCGSEPRQGKYDVRI